MCIRETFSPSLSVPSVSKQKTKQLVSDLNVLSYRLHLLQRPRLHVPAQVNKTLLCSVKGSDYSLIIGRQKMLHVTQKEELILVTNNNLGVRGYLEQYVCDLYVIDVMMSDSLPFIGAEIETPTNAKINGTTSVLHNKRERNRTIMTMFIYINSIR